MNDIFIHLYLPLDLQPEMYMVYTTTLIIHTSSNNKLYSYTKKKCSRK